MVPSSDKQLIMIDDDSSDFSSFWLSVGLVLPLLMMIEPSLLSSSSYTTPAIDHDAIEWCKGSAIALPLTFVGPETEEVAAIDDRLLVRLRKEACTLLLLRQRNFCRLMYFWYGCCLVKLLPLHCITSHLLPLHRTAPHRITSQRGRWVFVSDTRAITAPTNTPCSTTNPILFSSCPTCVLRERLLHLNFFSLWVVFHFLWKCTFVLEITHQQIKKGSNLLLLFIVGHQKSSISRLLLVRKWVQRKRKKRRCRIAPRATIPAREYYYYYYSSLSSKKSRSSERWEY